MSLNIDEDLKYFEARDIEITHEPLVKEEKR